MEKRPAWVRALTKMWLDPVWWDVAATGSLSQVSAVLDGSKELGGGRWMMPLVMRGKAVRVSQKRFDGLAVTIYPKARGGAACSLGVGMGHYSYLRQTDAKGLDELAMLFDDVLRQVHQQFAPYQRSFKFLPVSRGSQSPLAARAKQKLVFGTGTDGQVTLEARLSKHRDVFYGDVNLTYEVQGSPVEPVASEGPVGLFGL